MRRETEGVIRAKERVLKGEKVTEAAKTENVSVSAVYKALFRDGVNLKKGAVSAATV